MVQTVIAVGRAVVLAFDANQDTMAQTGTRMTVLTPGANRLAARILLEVQSLFFFYPP